MQEFVIHYLDDKNPLEGAGDTLRIFLESNKNKLDYADLSNLDLPEINLMKGNLRNCNLSNTNLSNALLYYTNMDNTKCINTNFKCASLIYTSFKNSNLTNSNFTKSNMMFNNLYNAILDNINMNWHSHELIYQILIKNATTIEQEQFAALISRKLEWCWDEWETMNHQCWPWLLNTLKPLVKDDDFKIPKQLLNHEIGNI